MNPLNVQVVDTETNGFLDKVTKMHCAVFSNIMEEVVATFTP